MKTYSKYEVIGVAAEISTRDEFAHVESPLVLRIVEEAAKSFAQTLGEPVAVPDGNDSVDSAIGWLVSCASRSIPFLMDEASKYEDDGSNEPLETARDIEKAIDDLAKVYGYSTPHHPTTEKGCE